MLPAANQRWLLKLCCPQPLSVCYWNCVVCSELVFAIEILCCMQWISIRCWNFALSAVNQCSLSNCSTRAEQFSLSNCVLANHFADNFLFQRISSLTSLCCSEPVCWRVCASANQFADELVVQWTNLLMSLCFNKLVCRWVSGVANQFANEFMFRQINFADYSVSSVLLTDFWSSELVHWWVCIVAN